MEQAFAQCGPGYRLIGDICDVAPPGYVETRSECEMGVESMEAAGVKQDFAAEIEKCRQMEAGGSDTDSVAGGTAGVLDWLLVDLPYQIYANIAGFFEMLT